MPEKKYARKKLPEYIKKEICTSSLSRKCPSFIVLHNPGSTMHLLVEIVIMGGVRKLGNTWGPLSPS